MEQEYIDAKGKFLARGLTEQEIAKGRMQFREHRKKCATGQKISNDGTVIEMRLSFERWFEIWLDSGHWHKRGRGAGKYVMSRKNDSGHYEDGNVFIQSGEQNVKDAHQTIRELRAEIQRLNALLNEKNQCTGCD